MRTLPLVVMALELESQGKFEEAGVSVLFTGVGKVNATYRLTRKLGEEMQRGVRPLVVNFGTAGSRKFATRSVVACRQFLQRDMDVTALGFPAHQTPFEDVPRELEFPAVFHQLEQGVCGSGDSFHADAADPTWEILDMEAYALAKVCRFEGVPFACAKFITDGADGNAPSDWQANLAHAAEAFVELYEWLQTQPADQ